MEARQHVFASLEGREVVLRGLKVLALLRHENLLPVMGMYVPTDPDFRDVYVVTPLWDTGPRSVLTDNRWVALLPS